MPTQTTTGSATSIDTDNFDLTEIGVELEYPLAYDESFVPAGNARGSIDVYHEFQNEEWLPSFGGNAGYIGTDHCGAEITSGILDLHSDEPETWYRSAIEAVEERGYTFAATGRGSSVFGLHMHVSSLADSARNAIENIVEDEWAKVFFCASVNEASLDPWRHYGSEGHRPFRRDHRGYSNHYEFRLPEPCLQDHFGLIMDFWRKIETDSVEGAIDFARERVHERDERLTPIVQYNQLRDNRDGWPTDRAFSESNDTDPATAEWFHDLME